MKNTLIGSQLLLETVVSTFEFQTKKKLSFSFLSCLNEQISAQLESLLAVKIDHKKLSFGCSFNLDKMQLSYGPISSFYTLLYVNHNWPRCKINWQSKSGKVYKLEDDIPDCSDVKFWLTDIDIVDIKLMLEPAKNPLPFKTNMFRFELEILDLAVDLTAQLQMQPEKINDAEKLMLAIDDFLAHFNLESEKQDRTEGVIHNRKRHVAGEHLVFEIDLGSTDMRFLAKWLKHLNRMDAFTKVTLR